MPPKADINRSGSESTDFPSVCENCLPENPYVQMIKENYGAECKICTRPFTVFKWLPDRNSRYKKTNICLTCARLKNCCQCCMLDLSFGLPIVVRDAALKLVAQGPSSEINKQYYAQNTENKLIEGQIPEEYEKTDSAARDLLKRLATSEPYYKRPRRNRDDGGIANKVGPGPVRTRGSGGERGRGGHKGPIRNFPSAAQLPPGPQDIEPPADRSITSLFLLGVEDDLAEHAIRTFFSAFGQIRSIVCVHHSRCAFVNFHTRAGAEAAAESCQGKAIIAGCPLRIMWGKPRPLGSIDRTQIMAIAKASPKASSSSVANNSEPNSDSNPTAMSHNTTLAPPGSEESGFLYPSQRPE
ncbi:Pre-mRNA-splicing factor slt11 [Orbilia oligospora]|uniref:Pre-mRNA-splicing factor slt11 n=1 Tax=Orbilia oligospora TaxID=2813651 RepID=A0A7C8NHF3_ORBOL|nr:Pre-mRNA-splicing factor slt11 [Orbilia oligospora]KAF3082841.1 Pre-mRNA-splicing factor slt11 [Orbilia oligospora]KAF3083675.1 Pre-mRNA-splicing factor slt11 [Orbilia oligospora]KAF3119079.1 Pre-mRNA-splicing factor slt11 [Orbilia oligospora]KAF3121640.1 Pre-mRNA-splicing factor slt11 [Orbilia oligospora]